MQFFAVTVVRLPLTYFTFKNFNSRIVFNFYRYLRQTFDAKCLNEFKPNSVVLTVFLRKSVCELKLQFNTMVGKISLIIVLERFSFTLNGQALDTSMVNTDKIILLKQILERAIVINNSKIWMIIQTCFMIRSVLQN